MPDLLPTDADEIGMLCLTSTRDYILRTNLRICDFHLGNTYHAGGDMKKAKLHYETAAMAGHEGARSNLGSIECNSGNMNRAVRHWIIAASAGHHIAMHILREIFEERIVSRDVIVSTLTAYINSCAEMRSEARDAYIGWHSDHTGER
jgi:hypothetical protein